MRRLVIVLALLVAACSDPKKQPVPPPSIAEPEATSLLGEKLLPPPLADDKRAEREKQLAEARAMEPADSVDRAVWIGRRLAYLGRYREAADAFTDGMAAHPNDPRLYRHRGHRWITLRRFDLAVADLERAAALMSDIPDEIEPDGQPNPRGGPVGSLRSNVWYHLGLAHYLRGEDGPAHQAWSEGLKIANNPDRLTSTSYWAWLALRRMGRNDEAKKLLEPIRPDWELVESQAYHKLMLLYRGDRTADDVLAAMRADPDAVARATIGYGLGMWHQLNGDRAKAFEIWRETRDRGTWPAFGFIAAEVELARSAASTRGTPAPR